MVYLYVMLTATHLSITMRSYHDIILAIMLQNLTMYTRYRHAGSIEKVISLLGKKNTDKKTLKDDSELGYSDFTLALTFHLPHPQQKCMQLLPMH